MEPIKINGKYFVLKTNEKNIGGCSLCHFYDRYGHSDCPHRHLCKKEAEKNNIMYFSCYFEKIIKIKEPVHYTLENLSEHCFVTIKHKDNVCKYVKLGNIFFCTLHNGQKLNNSNLYDITAFPKKGVEILSIIPFTIGKELIPQPTEYLVIDEEDNILTEFKSIKKPKIVKK